MLEVKTGCRLHFGLFELAEGEPLRYGGLGLMLAEPGWRLRFSKLDQPPSTMTVKGESESSAEICKRIEQVCERVSSSIQHSDPIQIEVVDSLPLHSGLGAGTQLAAATVIGIMAFRRLHHDQEESRILADKNILGNSISASELLHLSGRGKRSSIGLCGILQGGFILDHGLPAGYQERTDIPRSIHVERKPFGVDWPILLITPPKESLVSGTIESELITIAAQRPNPNREEMVHQAELAMRYATIDPSFEGFTTSMDRFVDHAGALFEPCQGGRFNGQTVQNAVQIARRIGLRGVGQSSWGPTVFGFAQDLKNAQHAVEQFAQLRPSDQWDIRICSASNSGASLEWYGG